MEQPAPTTNSVLPTTSTTSSFRLNCQRLFLTYPRCDLPISDALQLLRSKLDFEEYVIARELHQDGTPHLHVYLRRGEGKKFNIRSTTKLDLGQFHGNYQSVRSTAAVKKYVTKGNDFDTNIPPDQLNGDDLSVHQQALKMIATTATTTEILNLLATTKTGARDALMNRDRIVKTIAAMRPRATPIHHQLQDFKGWTISFDWTTVLILSGPTAVGKTSLAKALLSPNPLFVTAPDDLKLWDPALYSGIIIDEANFRSKPWEWTPETQKLFGSLNESVTIDMRYHGAFLTSGRRVIVTTNQHPVQILDWNDPAVKRRYSVVFVTALDTYDFSEIN